MRENSVIVSRRTVSIQGFGLDSRKRLRSRKHLTFPATQPVIVRLLGADTCLCGRASKHC